MPNETRWTPGPWDAQLDDAEIGETVAVLAGGAYIADVYGADSFPCLDEEEIPGFDLVTRANAHLIAAAPDLYEALAALHGEVERWALQFGIGYEGSELLEVMSDAKLALTKSRGEA